MPVKILKNPAVLPCVDATVKPIYPENHNLFGRRTGRAYLREDQIAGYPEIQVVCPREFSAEAFRRGYEACIRLAKVKKYRAIEIPLLLPQAQKEDKKALHLAVHALRGALDAEMMVYLVVREPDNLGLSTAQRQSLTQYIQHHRQETVKQKAVPFIREFDVACESAAPMPARGKRMAEPAVAAPAMAAPRPSAAGKKKLDEIVRGVDAGFSETLLKLIDESGKKDSEIYNKANVSRQHFSKIRNNPGYRPTKPTAIAFAIALELGMEQTKDLIGRAGYTLTRSSVFDLIIMYFIENKNYDLFEINEALFEFDQSLLGC